MSTPEATRSFIATVSALLLLLPSPMPQPSDAQVLSACINALSSLAVLAAEGLLGALALQGLIYKGVIAWSYLPPLTPLPQHGSSGTARSCGAGVRTTDR